MNPVTQSLLLSVLVEASLAMAVVVSLWSFFALRRRRRDVAAAQQLVESVRREEPERLSLVSDFVSRIIKGNDPSPIAERLLEEERDFYKRLIQIYLSRDAEAFSSLPLMVDALGESYRRLLLQAEGFGDFSEPVSAPPSRYLDEDDAPIPAPNLSHELISLRAEHGNLQEKFRITLDTMHRMVQEYASTYGKNCATLSNTTSDQILEALLVVSGADVPTKASPPPREPISLPPTGIVVDAPEIPEDESIETAFAMDEESFSEEENLPEEEATPEEESPPEPHLSEDDLLAREWAEALGETGSESAYDKPPPEVFPMEMSLEENSIESLMAGLLEPAHDPFEASPIESTKNPATNELAEFSWDDALLTDTSDFDVLQLEEVSVSGGGLQNRNPDAAPSKTADLSTPTTAKGAASKKADTATKRQQGLEDSPPIDTANEHLRSIVKAAEESWRGTDPARKR